MKVNSSTCTWIDNMAFDVEVDGYHFAVDASPDHGGQGKGPRPKPLLLTALAGCTGMDVVAILKKMREPLHSFSVRAEADLNDAVPAVYTEFRLIYEFQSADGLRPESVERAVKLSQERYCGVSAMLGQAAPVRFEIRYLPQA
jgi:putative redox protein